MDKSDQISCGIVWQNNSISLAVIQIGVPNNTNKSEAWRWEHHDDDGLQSILKHDVTEGSVNVNEWCTARYYRAFYYYLLLCQETVSDEKMDISTSIR